MKDMPVWFNILWIINIFVAFVFFLYWYSNGLKVKAS